MILAFYLSMPSSGSWNGRWSQEGNVYAIIERFTTKKAIANAKEILSRASYYYRWDDGWTANIKVKEVDSKEARKLKRQSKGFAGYDWMVTNIIRYGSTAKPLEEVNESATK